MFASGSISLSDGTPANVAMFAFDNSTWSAVGTGSDLPGPVTAVTVDNRNSSSIFAAGRCVISWYLHFPKLSCALGPQADHHLSCHSGMEKYGVQ